MDALNPAVVRPPDRPYHEIDPIEAAASSETPQLHDEPTAALVLRHPPQPRDCTPPMDTVVGCAVR